MFSSLLEAVEPYFDHSLLSRVENAQREWRASAQARFDELIGDEQLDAIRSEAEVRLSGLREEINRISESLRVEFDTSALDLPDIVVPECIETDLDKPAVLIDSRDDFVDQCADLIASKAYADVNGRPLVTIEPLGAES